MSFIPPWDPKWKPPPSITPVTESMSDKVRKHASKAYYEADRARLAISRERITPGPFSWDDWNKWNAQLIADKILKPKQGSGRPEWVKGMPSPNPAGRPAGTNSPDTKRKLDQRMLDSVEGIMEVMITRALAGDTAAATLVVNKVLPNIKSQLQKVNFTLNADASGAQQVSQVLTAVSEGEVAPDVGKRIVELVQSLAQVRAVEDLEQRILKLEEKQL